MTNISIDKQISERVKERRLYLFRTSRRNLSQTHLAELAGIPRATYANKENGEYPFSASELGTIAKILDVDVNYFYGMDYYHEDVPPELETVYGLQGKVLNYLPPGQARQKYIEKLRADAEHNWEMLRERLNREEGQDDAQ